MQEQGDSGMEQDEFKLPFKPELVLQHDEL